MSNSLLLHVLQYLTAEHKRKQRQGVKTLNLTKKGMLITITDKLIDILLKENIPMDKVITVLMEKQTEEQEAKLKALAKAKGKEKAREKCKLTDSLTKPFLFLRLTL